MSDAKKKDAAPPVEAPKADAAAPAKKKPPIKAIGIVLGVMAIEAVAIFMLVGKSGAAPASSAAEVQGHAEAEKKETIEIPLIEEKFQNMQTGKTWIWDVQLVLKVKQKHEALFTEQLEKRAAEMKEGLAQIFRRAQHSHLCEPELTTINRQVHAFMDRAIGLDADGNSRIERIIIPKCRGIQIEQ